MAIFSSNDSSNTTKQEHAVDKSKSNHPSTQPKEELSPQKVGAGVAAGLGGSVVGGVAAAMGGAGSSAIAGAAVVGTVAGLSAAHLTDQEGTLGDSARSLGDAAVDAATTAKEKAVEFDKEHNIGVVKAMDWAAEQLGSTSSSGDDEKKKE